MPQPKYTVFVDQICMPLLKNTVFTNQICMPQPKNTVFVDQICMPRPKNTVFVDQICMPRFEITLLNQIWTQRKGFLILMWRKACLFASSLSHIFIWKRSLLPKSLIAPSLGWEVGNGYTFLSSCLPSSLLLVFAQISKRNSNLSLSAMFAPS